VTVDRGEDEQRTGPCACEQYNLIWGNKVNCEFRKKVVEISAELWGEQRKIQMANALMAVMNVETNGTFAAHQIEGRRLMPLNSITAASFQRGTPNSSRAVGLIQFTQGALEQLGEFRRGSGFPALNALKLRFARMGEIAQLDYVKRYFELNGAPGDIRNPEDVYLHVFAPSGVGRSNEFVLYRGGTEEYDRESVDADNDGNIQRREILARFRTSSAEGQANRAVIRNCTNQPNPPSATADAVTYRIEASGTIQKLVPSEIAAEYRGKYHYVLVDDDGTEHELGVFSYVTANRWQRRGVPGEGQVQLVDARQFRGYADGGVRL